MLKTKGKLNGWCQLFWLISTLLCHLEQIVPVGMREVGVSVFLFENRLCPWPFNILFKNLFLFKNKKKTAAALYPLNQVSLFPNAGRCLDLNISLSHTHLSHSINFSRDILGSLY